MVEAGATTCVFVRMAGPCFFQAEDGIRDVERSRGLGDVYKRQKRDEGPLAGPVGAGIRAVCVQPRSDTMLNTWLYPQ